MKVHLYRSNRSTWCGLVVADHPNLNVMRGVGVSNLKLPSCLTCIRADAAEQRKQDAASG